MLFDGVKTVSQMLLAVKNASSPMSLQGNAWLPISNIAEP
jgi:hypothetical protein